ncbi:DUF3732 domain-containing protein [Streptomyces sp. NPDC056663]|uniref:DUF3732 domain-containing protein n=1 Tax=Streptomyces sp. NPDC056663 TaxID=3345899 RepID=UPI00368B6307
MGRQDAITQAAAAARQQTHSVVDLKPMQDAVHHAGASLHDIAAARTPHPALPGKRPEFADLKLMHQVVSELAPNFQMIVSDHADLPHDWYQDSIRYNWRNGEKLIPTTWLDDSPTP